MTTLNPIDEAVTARHERQISRAFAAKAQEHRDDITKTLSDPLLLERGLSLVDRIVSFHERQAGKLQHIADWYAHDADAHQRRAVA